MTVAERVRASFSGQSLAMERYNSPFMACLMRLCAQRLSPGTPVTDRVLNWAGDPSAQADNVSMRLAAGLHALAISNTAPELAAVYPPNEVEENQLWDAISTAFTAHSEWLLPWLDSPPQTNEIRRAGTIIPAMHLVAARSELPLALWEIGCSAGLALRADRFHLAAGKRRFGPADAAVRLAPEWEGIAPPATTLTIAERRGVDLAPMDPARPEHRLRLLSYLWPDQPERRRLTEAAISEAIALPAEIDRADALDWLADGLPRRPVGATTFLFHTVAWQYLPPEARARGAAMIAAEGARATPENPLAHFSMEADGNPDAALTLHIWPGNERISLGRAHFHGLSVRWTA